MRTTYAEELHWCEQVSRTQLDTVRDVKSSLQGLLNRAQRLQQVSEVSATCSLQVMQHPDLGGEIVFLPACCLPAFAVC